MLVNTAKNIPEKSYYFSQDYLNEGRFVDYHHTVRLAMQPGVQDILEIGPGNGLVTWVLRNAGYRVHTFDCEPTVIPDTLGDIRDLPFSPKSFDVVVCSQVLEHLPFEFFSPVLRQFLRVSRRYAVISLPHVIPCWSLIARLPFIGHVWGSVPIPHFSSVDMSEHPEHFWSIGSKGCSDRAVEKAILEVGWSIKACYRPGYNKDHKFFCLEYND